MKDSTRKNRAGVSNPASGPLGRAPGKSSRTQRRYGGVPAPVRSDRDANAIGAVEGDAARTTADLGPGPDAAQSREPETLPETGPTGPRPAIAPGDERGDLPGPEARYRAKETLRTQIEAQITQEDAERSRGDAKTRTTRAQLTEELAAAAAASAAARPALDSGRGYEAPLSVFERAVDALHGAYLASTMQSTDGEVDGFEPGADLDILGSSAAHAKMLQWQLASREHYNGTVKFAVPPPDATGGQLVCRVGNPMAVGHNQVGGGDAIAAGFIRVEETGYVVTAFENTSGGYRPGWLRNATARAAIEAAQPIAYAITEGARHDNPTGSYDTSTIDRG